jgi:hypothetical protein
MPGIGDGIVVLMAFAALIYGIYMLIAKKLPFFFQLSVAAVACLLLGYVFDVCDYIVNDMLEEEYFIGYLGSIGSFLFLLTASVGYMDGIIDDGSPELKKHKYIALIAPALAAGLWIPNMLSDTTMATKVVYSVLWLPAMCSSYFNLKHAIIPDLDFGFIKAIKPYNVFVLCLSFSELLSLTAWDYFNSIWIAVMSTVFGVLCVCTMISAKKGVKKWTI